MPPRPGRGDALPVTPATPTRLRVGDLVLFHDRGRLICHRLVAMNDGGSPLTPITKGDAVAAADPPLQPDQILGKVIDIRRSRFRLLSWSWLDPLPLRLDRCREWLIDRVAGALGVLQSLRGYRRIMRALLSRCFVYDLGLPAGRWYRYEPIAKGRPLPPAPEGFQLLAKLVQIPVGSLRVVPTAGGYRLEALYVRVRYRGLGVASQLLTFACHLASQSGARRLLATVEAENSGTLPLFDKMAFRSLPGSEPCGTAVLFRELPG